MDGPLGGGWTVIQRRGDFGNDQDFFLRNWTEYRNGFGSPNKELWIMYSHRNFLISKGCVITLKKTSEMS